ncbi:MAG TPA: HesA/MoeB/ThiF family protein [Desulfomonilaceae bacterium]|nr:HesA/MoeB/ThiF family protein [Desulfomonilaceae bacterium]
MEVPVPRYSRHILLKVIGEDGQRNIEKSRVLVAGLGALGSTAAMLLARAGVKFLRIADVDSPELHNLHRQILYDERDTVREISKAQAAAERLRAANSHVEVEAVHAAIVAENIERLIDDVDLVVDALDNARTRYIVNDAILARGIPYVFGGAIETCGNVMTIIPGETPCLRCIWPDPEAVLQHPTAATVGILSSAASAVASMEVTEALKILAGKQHEILQGLLVMDVWRGTFCVAHVEANPDCICRKDRSKAGQDIR